MTVTQRTLLVVLTLIHVGLASISSYVALGDSYPAGDGAGSPRPWPSLDLGCGRFDHAYPVQLANLLSFPSFSNVACGGATVQTVLHHQLHSIRDVDLVTIQVGGNEVDFFPVVNECIFQWKPLSTCDRALERARSKIQSTRFLQAYNSMVKHALDRAHDRDLVLVLGYAQFFNAETEQCNGVSFSRTNPANVLSNQLRRAINELVVMLNNVIEAAAVAHGATYVDVDIVFEGHRFCEEGVQEPRPDWKGTWFYRERPRHEAGQVNVNTDRLLDQAHRQGVLSPFAGFADLIRTFHPTIEGHAAIATALLHTTKNM